MKTFLHWRETTTAAGAAADTRDLYKQYGAAGASGFQDIVQALQAIATQDPQKFARVVNQIRTVLAAEDGDAARAAMAGARRFQRAVGSASKADGQGGTP